jgi:hypothetical protein
MGLVEAAGPKIRDLEQAADFASEIVLADDGDGKFGLFGGAERQKQ